jgi:galactokinase
MPKEMKEVAEFFGEKVLSRITMQQLLASLPLLRKQCGDRACLRAIHFINETNRVIDQKTALENKDIDTFLALIIASGQSSYMYLQNVYMPTDTKFQPIAIALALSQQILKGGAYRVHGGGLAGTIQAFVRVEQLSEYIQSLEHVFGSGRTYNLAIRSIGSLQVF